MTAIATRDCTTCKWGVRWDCHPLIGELRGTCQWVCPVPHPRVVIMPRRFKLSDEPETDCQAYELAVTPGAVCRWREEFSAYQRRLIANVERLASELKALAVERKASAARAGAEG